MNRLIFVATTIFSLINSACFLSGQESDPDVVRKCSVFAAAFDNADSVRTGDVLIKRTIVHDTVKSLGDKSSGVFRESKFVDRIVFDFEHNRYCQMQKKDTEWIDFADVEKKELFDDMASVPTGWCIDWEAMTVFNSKYKDGLNFRVFGKSSLHDVLTRAGFIDPRVSGLLPFWNHVQIDDAREYFAKRSSGLHFLDEAVAGEKLTIRLEFKGKIPDRETFEFDLTNSFLRRFRSEAWHADDAKWYPQESFEIDWQEIDVFFVPTKVRSKYFKTLDSLDGKSYYGEEEATTELQWFSVNQPIDPKYFDGTVVSSTESILEHLKPQKKKPEYEKGNPKK